MMVWAWILASHAAPMSTDEIVAAALAASPALAAARAEVERAEAGLAGVKGLAANPTLDVRLGFGLPQHEIALSQPVSWSGEGIAAVAAATAELRAAEASAARVELEVAADARRALAVAAAAASTRALADALWELTRVVREAVEARRAAGELSDLDVQLARLDEGAAAADRLAAGRAAEEARAALLRAAALPWEVELPEDPLAALPAQSEARASRSDVEAAAATLDAAQAAVRRERAAAIPPVEIGVWAQVQNVGVSSDGSAVVIPRGDPSANLAWTVGPSLSWTLPVFKANPDGRGQAAADVAEAASRARAVDAAVAIDRARAGELRAWIADALALPDPGVEARAALDALARAVGAGELSTSEAATLRARVMDAWRRAHAARSPAIEAAIELALAEEWATLAPAR